ncbi:MAG: bile acid:sodium symporter [Bacteroidales bacterium]|nr:bile acid:sodium symporter [Bacteroidales bacterium]MDD4685410.1 bile acid:sodium symporter [Bacteroidales bacterium]
MNSLFIVMPILIFLMFCIGLELRLSNFKLILKQPKSIILGTLSQLIIHPLIAWFLLSFVNIPDEFKIGIILIASCPGGASSNAFSFLVKGDVALSVLLTSLSSLLSIFTIPIIISSYIYFSIGDSLSFNLPFFKLLMQNVVFLLLPIVFGMLLNRYKEEFAKKLSLWTKKLPIYLLLILITAFFIENMDVIIQNFSKLSILIFILVIGVMLISYFIALVFKIKTEQRKAIVIGVGIKNAAQAMLIAASPIILNNPKIAIPAVLYALIMNIVILVYVAVNKRKSKLINQ